MWSVPCECVRPVRQTSPSDQPVRPAHQSSPSVQFAGSIHSSSSGWATPPWKPSVRSRLTLESSHRVSGLMPGSPAEREIPGGGSDDHAELPERRNRIRDRSARRFRDLGDPSHRPIRQFPQVCGRSARPRMSRWAIMATEIRRFSGLRVSGEQLGRLELRRSTCWRERRARCARGCGEEC